MELDETNFDVIVLGTGFAESVAAGALARAGKRVLHLDQNDFYGGYMSSYNLAALDKTLRADTPQAAVDPIAPPNDQLITLPVSRNVGPIFHNVKIYKTEAPVQQTPSPATTEQSTISVTETPTNTEGEQAQETAPPETSAAETQTGEASAADIQTEKQVEPQTNESEQASVSQASTVEEPVAPSQVPTPALTADEEQLEPEEAVITAAEVVPFPDLLEDSRHYSIDLVPRLLLSRGPMVNLLISSAVGRYLEFKCYEKSYLYTSNTLQPVPCSKSDIFKSKFITNSERRMLGRFLQLIQEDMQQPGKIDRERYLTLYDFVKAQGLTPKLEEFIFYSISLLSSNQEDPAYRVTSTDGLKSLQTYISSIEKYGNTPYLFPMYGCSEIPQAFCRLAAVYGGIYVLRRTAKCLLLDAQTREFKGVICSEGQTLNATHFVTSSEYLPQFVNNPSPVKKSSRCIVITNRPLSGEGASEGMSFVVIPPNSPIGNKHVIHVLQLDSKLYATPRRKYVLHFITETTTNAEEDLSAAVSLLLNVPGADTDSAVSTSALRRRLHGKIQQDALLFKHVLTLLTDQGESSECKKPSALWRAYFEMWAHTNPTVVANADSTYPPNVYVVNEGPLDTGVDMGELINEAQRVFAQVCPNDEFLPRVPNPEDIIWTEEAVEAAATTEGG